MSTKRKRSASPAGHDELATIYRSEEILDRQSRFVGFYSPMLPPKDLQALAEFSKADHKVLGWRRESNQQSLTSSKKYVSGNDDDGEKYAGKKVEQCLINANVTGACVVARYYGGIMLGPVRFTHIETCALEAIHKWRDAVAEAASKKLKRQQDTRDKERLVKVLVARDQSITTLRALAKQKEDDLSAVLAKDSEKADETPSATASASATATATATASSAPLTIDYANMEVDRLRAVEKARDATLSFLLKRINKAEVELKRAEDVSKPAP